MRRLRYNGRPWGVCEIGPRRFAILVRAMSAVPVAAGLAAGTVLIADAGWPWWVLSLVLFPIGAVSVAVAYSAGHVPASLAYGGVVVLAAAVMGGIWQAPEAVPGELSGFWVGFVFLGGWALGSVVLGGLGLVGWRHVNRARGGRR